MNKFKQLVSVFVLLAVAAVSANAQSHKVSGVVSSTTGESLIGAGVLVKGTTAGTVTGVDGSYSLQVPDGATLVFSCIGYNDAEYVPGPKSTLNVILEEDLKILEEAVVVGYGVQSKVTLTGSVTSTSGNDLVKNSTVNLSQGLAGRIAGVIVSNRSGEPGRDDPTIFIRGRSTLGDNSPLIIIDGVQGRDSDFSRLTGEEIESVNVLKDVSANIYGARAANGVIVVTTKRGKFNNAPNVTFTYDMGLQQPTRIVQMADAALYAKAYNAELAITGRKPVYTEAEIAAYADGSDPVNYPNTNWSKEVFKPLSAQNKYGVSINGGGERVAYFVQLNGQSQDGIYKNSSTNFDQFNVRSNIDVKVTKNLSVPVTTTLLPSFPISAVTTILPSIPRLLPSRQTGNLITLPKGSRSMPIMHTTLWAGSTSSGRLLGSAILTIRSTTSTTRPFPSILLPLYFVKPRPTPPAGA